MIVFELRMNENYDDKKRFENARLAAERFMSTAEQLPEGKKLFFQANPHKDTTGRTLISVDEDSDLAKKDVAWIFGECADVWDPGHGRQEIVNEQRRHVYVLCSCGTDCQNSGTSSSHERKSGKDIDVSELSAALKSMVSRIIVSAAKESRTVRVSSSEPIPLRVRTMFCMTFPGIEIMETLDEAPLLPRDTVKDIMTGLIDMITEEIERELPSNIFIDTVDDEDDDIEEDEYTPDYTPIEELDLSVRSYNSLKRAFFNTVEDILEFGTENLIKIRNLGRKGVEEVKQKLEHHQTKTPEKEEKRAPFEELGDLIGLAEVKEQVRRITAFARMKQDMEALGKPGVPIVLNMEFTGNPGTAKTTVARIFAGIFSEIGLLESNEIVEVGRADIVAKYVGWTADNVKEIFKRAKGKLLFIDEAYSLKDQNRDSFGDEAINAIVQEMENNRSDTVVVFAGYPDEMKEFFARNPGLRSRVPFHISFKDYSVEEMVSIAELEAKKRGFTIAEDAKNRVMTICDAAKSNRETGNGRFCRNLVEEAILCYAARVYGAESENAEKDFTLGAGDFAIPENARTEAKPIRRIGFAA